MQGRTPDVLKLLAKLRTIERRRPQPCGNPVHQCTVDELSAVHSPHRRPKQQRTKTGSNDGETTSNGWRAVGCEAQSNRQQATSSVCVWGFAEGAQESIEQLRGVLRKG